MAKKPKNQQPYQPFATPDLDAHEITYATEDETVISKCPSCGGDLAYNPSTFTLRCKFCGKDVEIQHRSADEIDFNKLVEGSGGWNKDTRIFECNSCGARQVLSRKNMSPKCAFCGTANVVALDAISGLKPTGIIPFSIGERDAQERYRYWARKKFFSPRKFKKQTGSEKLSGHYFPAFTFDSQTVTRYSGQLGIYYYTTHTRSDGTTYTVRHTRWYNIGGTYNRFFNDILVQASAQKEQVVLDKIMPFDTDHSNKYTDDYLYGFSASQYEKDGLHCWQEARGIMQYNVKNEILAGYRYDVIGRFDFNMQCHDVTYKYLLLPVYIGHATYRKKLYNFYMNGQNGKIAGKTPKSVGKILSFLFGGLALVAGAVCALIFLL